MTWDTKLWPTAGPLDRKRTAASGALAGVLAFILAACGDDSDATLAVVDPEDGDVLTLQDSTADEDTGELHYDVKVEAGGLAEGTAVQLLIDSDVVDDSGEVDGNGEVLFEDVVLPPGEHSIQAEKVSGGVQSAEDHVYTFRHLVIESPEEGALSVSDDADEDEAGFQLTVEVALYAIEEEVVLLVDGESAGEEEDAEGDTLTFTVTLEPGEHTLVARAGDIESVPVEVTLAESATCGEIRLLQPVADGDTVTFGTDDCPESGPFTTDVEISADFADGTTGTLFVNGRSVGSAQVEDGEVLFEDVALGLRASANRLSVEFDTDASCAEEFDVDVFVSCGGPDCQIVAPVPVSYVEEGASQEFLNAGQAEGGMFAFTVASSGEAEGQTVELEVDGEVLTAEPSAQDDGLFAEFSVGLEEGAHTLVARCIDGEGTTDSGEENWTVDLTPCGVTIDRPEAGESVLSTADADLDTDGVQVQLDTSLEGDDCVAVRAAVCDPEAGITDGEFEPLSSDASLLLTVGDEAGEQVLCVEVQDRAGNGTLESVAVDYADALDDVVALAAYTDQTSPNYRTDPVALRWVTPTNLGLTFSGFELRCSVVPFPNPADESLSVEMWWQQADEHLRADGSNRFVLEDAGVGTLSIPAGGTPLHCMMVACDESDNCSELPTEAVSIEKPFRQVLVDGPTETAHLGDSVVPVGDVNGDGLPDALVTAVRTSTAAADRTGAYLYFGRDFEETGASMVPDVSFTRPTADEAYAALGFGVAALGDFNGDDRPDFALASPAADNFQGVIYVFLGRQDGDAWPEAVDLAGTDCAADLCIRASDPGMFLGGALAGVGNFDGDGPNDLAVTAQGSANSAGAVYVLLGRDGDLACDNATCDSRGGSFFGVTRSVAQATSGDFDGFVATQTSASVALGEHLVAVGRSGGVGDTTDDLLVSQFNGPLFSFTGRAYTGGGGLQEVAFSELVQVLPGPFNVNTTFAMLGDVWTPPATIATQSDLPDLAVHERNTSFVMVYPGDSSVAGGFDTSEANRLRIEGAGFTGFGASVCQGHLPALGWTSGTGPFDVDADGQAPVCFGGTANGDNERPGRAYYIEGDLFARLAGIASLPGYYNSEFQAYVVWAFAADPTLPGATDITPDGTASSDPTDTGLRNVQVVGDLTGDGAPDIIVGDLPRLTETFEEVGGIENQGGFWLLY